MALDANLVSETINIGPDEGTITVKDMATMVAEECGVDLEPIHMPDRPREVKHASCSAEKARKLLNYETKTTLEESVRQTVEYVRNRGTKEFDYSYPLEIVTEKTPKTWSQRLM